MMLGPQIGAISGSHCMIDYVKIDLPKVMNEGYIHPGLIRRWGLYYYNICHSKWPGP